MHFKLIFQQGDKKFAYLAHLIKTARHLNENVADKLDLAISSSSI